VFVVVVAVCMLEPFNHHPPNFAQSRNVVKVIQMGEYNQKEKNSWKFENRRNVSQKGKIAKNVTTPETHAAHT